MKVSILTILTALCTITVVTAQQTFYDVTPGNGYGLRFWQSDSYKIHMGNGSEYNYGPVTGYSIKHNMSSDAGRGWTWGLGGTTPVAALSNQGQMQVAGSIYAGSIYSPSGNATGRLSATGSMAELSLLNRSVSSFIESPSNGERWVIYNNGTPTDGKLRFWSGGDKAAFNKEGNLGIGTTSPYAWSRLHAKSPGSNPWGILTEASTNDKVIALGHDGTYGVVAVSYLSSGGWSPLQFRTQNIARMTIVEDGNVGIGTTAPDSKLTVKGTIHSQEVKVDLAGAVAPDYVFEKGYPLTSLEELKSYIEENKHLPEIPSAKEMEENGINLKDMNLMLLKKVEELTLHQIESARKIETLEKKLSLLLKDN